MAKTPYSDPSSIGPINLTKPEQLEAVQDVNNDDVLNPQEIADTTNSAPPGFVEQELPEPGSDQGQPGPKTLGYKYPKSKRSLFYSDPRSIDMTGFSQDLAFSSMNQAPAGFQFTGQFTDSPSNKRDRITWRNGLSREDLFDIEDVRAQGQTAGDKLAMFIPKLIGKTAVNVFGGTVGIANGLGNVMRASIDKDMDAGWHNFYQNDLVERMDEWNKLIDNKLPYYYSKKSREGNFWDKAGAMNFWTDQLANGMSFLAGALVTELIWTAAAGATGLTGNPAGAAGLVANTTRLLGQAKALFKGGAKVATVKAGKEFAEEATKKMTAAAAVQGTKPTAFQKSMNVLKYPRRFLTGAGYEASIEAHHHYERLKRDLIASKKREKVRNGLAPELTDQELMNIEESVRSSSNAVFGLNTILVGMGHLLMLPTVYGPGISAIGKFNAFKPRTWNTLGWAGVTETGKTTFKPKWVARKDWITKNLGLSEKAAERLVKSAGVAQAGVGVGIYEGGVEEAGQAYFDIWGYDYTMARHRMPGHKWTNELVKTGIDAMGKTWGDPKSQVEIALGFILGTIGIPGVRQYNQGSLIAAKGRIDALYRDRALGERIAEFSKKPEFHSMLPSLNAHFRALATSSNIRNMRDDLIASGNFSKAKDLDHDDFFTYVHAKHLTGQFEDIYHDAEGVKNMSTAEFKDAMGYAEDNSLTEKELEDRKNKVAENAVERANKIREAIKHVDNISFTLTEGMDPANINEFKTHLAHIVSTADNIDERESKLVDNLAELTGGTVVESSGKPNEGARYRVRYKTGEDTYQDYDLGGLSEPSIIEHYKYLQDILNKDSKNKLVKNLSPEERAAIEQKANTLKEYINNQSSDVDLSQLSVEEQSLLFDEGGQVHNWLANDLKGTQKLKDVLQIIKDLRRLRSKRHAITNEYNRIVFGGSSEAKSIIKRLRQAQEDAKDEDDAPSGLLEGKARDLYRTYGSRASFSIDGVNYRFGQDGQLFRDLVESSNPTDLSTDPVDPSILENVQTKDIKTNEMVEAAKALEAIKKIKNFKESELNKITEKIAKFKQEVADKLKDFENEYSKVGQVTETVEKIGNEIKSIEKTITDLQVAKHEIVEQISTFDTLVEKYYDPETLEFRSGKDIGLKNIQNVITDIASDLSLESGVHRSRLGNIKQRTQEKIDEIRKSILELQSNNLPVVETLTAQMEDLIKTRQGLEKVIFNRLRKKMKGLKGINSINDLFQSEFSSLETRLDKLRKQPELPGVSFDTQQLLKEFEVLKELMENREIVDYDSYKQYTTDNPSKLPILSKQFTTLLEAENLLESSEFKDENLDATIEEIKEISEIAEALEEETKAFYQALNAPVQANQFAKLGLTIRGLLKSLNGIELPLEQAAENAPINPKPPVAAHENYESTPQNNPVKVSLKKNDDGLSPIPDIAEVGLKKSAANFHESYSLYFGLSQMVNGELLPLDNLTDQQKADRDGAYLDLVFYDALADEEMSARMEQGDFVLKTLVAKDYKPGNPVYDELGGAPIFYSKATQNYTADSNDSYHQDPSTADIKLVYYTTDGQLVKHKNYPLLSSMEDGTRALDEKAFTNKHGIDRQSAMNEHIAFRNSILSSVDPFTMYISYLSDPVSITEDPYTGEPLVEKSVRGRAFPANMENKDADLRVATTGSITLDSGVSIEVQPGFKYIVHNNKVTQLSPMPISTDMAAQVVNYLRYFAKNLDVLRSQGLNNKTALSNAGIVEHEGQSYDLMNTLEGLVNYGARTENHKYGIWPGLDNKVPGFYYKNQVLNAENELQEVVSFISDKDLIDNNSLEINKFGEYILELLHNVDNSKVKNSKQGVPGSITYNAFNLPYLNADLEVYKVDNYDNYLDYLFSTDALMTRAQLPDGGPVAPQTRPRYSVYNEGNTKGQEIEIGEEVTAEELEVLPVSRETNVKSNKDRLNSEYLSEFGIKWEDKPFPGDIIEYNGSYYKVDYSENQELTGDEILSLAEDGLSEYIGAAEVYKNREKFDLTPWNIVKNTADISDIHPTGPLFMAPLETLIKEGFKKITKGEESVSIESIEEAVIQQTSEENQQRLNTLEDEFDNTGLDDIANMTLEMGVSPDLIVEGGVILTQYDDNAEPYVGPAELINVHYQANQALGQALKAFKPGVGLIVKDKVFREVTDPLDISWNRAMAKELEELDLTPTGYNLPGEIAKGNVKIKYITYSAQDIFDEYLKADYKNATSKFKSYSDPRFDKSINGQSTAHYVALFAEDINKEDDYVIGAIRVEFDKSKTNAYVGKSSIAPGLIGRGIGQNLYLLTNNILQEKYNQVLQSDSNGTTSMEATYAWESLTRRGFAESIDVSTKANLSAIAGGVRTTNGIARPRWSMKRSIPEGRPIQEIEAEIAKAQKMLPKNQIEIVSGFIGDANNRVVGQVRGFGKTLVSNLGLGGEVYHETFHQTSMFILSKEESNSIYDEFRSLEGDVRTYKGKKKKFSELTNKEADEYAAEEFRHWILSEGNYKSDLYGTFKKKPKTLLGRIFTKIKAVLQGLLGLNNNMQPTAEMQKTAELFQNIESGYYAKHDPNLERDQGSVANMARLPQLSDNRSTEATELITNYFSNILFFDKKSSLNITDLSTDKMSAEEKIDFTEKIEQAYNRTFLLLERDLRRRLSRAEVQEDEKTIQQTKQDIDYFTNNKDEIINIHKQWLSNLGLSFTVEYNEQLEERNQTKDSLGIFSGYRANEFSSVTGATPMLKFLIGTLPNSGNRNSFGLIGSKDYNDTMVFLHSKLQGLMDPRQQRAELENLRPTNVWIKELLRRLGNFESKDLRDVTLQTAFYNQFSQSKTNAYTNILKDNSADSILVEANKSNRVQEVKNNWVNNLRLDTSGFVKVDPDQNLILDLNKELPYTIKNGIKNISINSFKKNKKGVQNLTPTHALEFLGHLGIKFSDSNNVLASSAKEIKEAVIYIVDNLKQDNAADLFNSELDIQGRLNKLVDAEIQNSDSLGELMYQTPSGTRKYSINQNTYFHHVANLINNAKLPQHLDPNNNPFTANSITIKSLIEWLQLPADKRLTTNPPNVEVSHLLGMSIDEKSTRGKDWSAMNVSERLLFTIENTLKGKSIGFRTADAKTQYLYDFPTVGNYSKIQDAENILLGYLEDEIHVSAVRNKEGFGSDIAVYRDQAKDLRLFKGILTDALMSDELREDLNRAIKGEHLENRGSENSVIVKHKQEIISLIDKYFTAESQDAIQRMIDNKIATQNLKQGVYTIYGLSPEVISNFAGSKVISRDLKGQTYIDKINKTQMENIAYAYILNEFIGDNEQFRVFFGDPAQYTKNDVYKKFKGAAAFKTLARNDDAINKQLNDPANRRADNKIEDGTFNLKVFDDPVSESMMSDLYETVLGEDANAYREMKEADGQILASLHHYRSLMYRTTGFSPAQEAMYQRLYNKDLPNPTRGELLAAFPIIKPQYWGPQMVGGRPNLMAFLKMSLAPLIPNVIADNPNLVALAQTMEETGTDGVLFPSAFKMGYKVNTDGTLDSFYRSGDLFDGDVNTKGTIRPIEPGSYNTLDIGYMGIQLEVSPNEKSTATKGVQPTTLILSNIYEDGEVSEVTEEGLATAAEEYIELQNGLTKQKFEKVLDDLNLKRNEDGSFTFKNNDMSVLIKHLKDQMTLSKFSENAIAGVEAVLSPRSYQHLKNRVFDILPNSNDIESLLFSIVTNNVIKQKFKGDLKVLQSPTGYENGVRILKADNTLVAGYFNEDGIGIPTLRSYTWDPEDPSKQTIGAEIYLPHYFAEYFEEDLVIGPAGIYNDNGDLISTDEGLLELIAYRIPTGGMNLIDSFIIKGFLPKNAGPTMVIPAELTIKESLDFDIDKQTTYFKSYRRTVGGNLVQRKYIYDYSGLKEDGTSKEALGLIYDERYNPTLEFYETLNNKIKLIKGLRAKQRYSSTDEEFANLKLAENMMKAIFGERSLDYSEAEIEILVDTFRSLDKDATKLQLGETIGDSQYSKSREDYAIEQYEELKKRIKNIPTKEDFIQDALDRELTYAEVNHPGAVQNRIMDLMKYMLLHPSNRADLLRPTGPENILEMGEFFAPEEKAEEKTWTEIMSPQNKLEMLDRFVGSTDGLGIAATNNTHIIKSQIAGLQVNKPLTSVRFGEYQIANRYASISKKDLTTTYIPGTNIPNTLSIAKKYDLDGNLITTQSNIVLNALADAVKNPAIYNIGITPETLGVAYYLMRLGIPLGTVKTWSPEFLDMYENEEEWKEQGGHIKKALIPLFLSQPIILEYLDAIRVNNSSHVDNKYGIKLSNKQVEDAVRKNFMPSKAKIKDMRHLYNWLTTVRKAEDKRIVGETDTDGLITYYNEEDLFDMFTNNGGRSMENETAKDNTLLMQQNILTDFLEYQQVGDALMELTKSSAFDTLRPRSRQDARFMVARIQKVISNPMFNNAEKLITKTHLHELARVIGYSRDMFSQLFLTDRPNVRKMSGLDNIVNRYTDPNLGMADKDVTKILQRAQNDLIAAALNANIYKDVEFEGEIFKQTLHDRAESLMIGKNSLPYLIQDELSKNPDNVLLQGLIPILQSNIKDPNGLKYYTKALDVYRQNVLAESFMELSDELQDKLIDFAILQSGLNSTDMSFLKILPYERYIEKALSIVDSLNNITDTKSQNPDWITNFEVNFYRNNWENRNIVPKISNFAFKELKKGKGHKYDGLSFFNYNKKLIGLFTDPKGDGLSKIPLQFLSLGDGKFFLEYPAVGSQSILSKNRIIETTQGKPEYEVSRKDEAMNNNDEKAQIDNKLEEDCP